MTLVTRPRANTSEGTKRDARGEPRGNEPCDFEQELDDAKSTLRMVENDLLEANAEHKHLVSRCSTRNRHSPEAYCRELAEIEAKTATKRAEIVSRKIACQERISEAKRKLRTGVYQQVNEEGYRKKTIDLLTRIADGIDELKQLMRTPG